MICPLLFSEGKHIDLQVQTRPSSRLQTASAEPPTTEIDRHVSVKKRSHETGIRPLLLREGISKLHSEVPREDMQPRLFTEMLHIAILVSSWIKNFYRIFSCARWEGESSHLSFSRNVVYITDSARG